MMQTLNSFFNFQKGSNEWINSIISSQGFGEAKQLFSQDLPGFQPPPSFFELMLAKLPEAMEVDIAKILVGAWRKHREIAQYRDMTSPSEGYHEVALLEHTIRSKHSPTIQPVINGVAFPKLRFDITLQLDLQGGRLFIRGGKIMKATTGTCTGRGTIEFKGHKIYEKKTQSYQLPGEIVFDPGIAI
jgi:hypothetical protein